MLGRKVKSRIFYLILFLAFTTTIIFITLKSLEDNVIYFFSPTEIYNKPSIPFNKKIRIGGLAKEGSTKKSENSINFIKSNFCTATPIRLPP